MMRKVGAGGIENKSRLVGAVAVRYRLVHEPEVPNHLAGVVSRSSRLSRHPAQGNDMVIDDAEREEQTKPEADEFVQH